MILARKKNKNFSYIILSFDFLIPHDENRDDSAILHSVVLRMLRLIEPPKQRRTNEDILTSLTIVWHSLNGHSLFNAGYYHLLKREQIKQSMCSVSSIQVPTSNLIQFNLTEKLKL